MFLAQVAKVMNKSVQSVLRWVYQEERSFKKGDGRLPISYNNGVIGATSSPLCISIQPHFQIRPSISTVSFRRLLDFIILPFLRREATLLKLVAAL